MAKLSTVFAICVGIFNLSLIFACNCEVKHPQTQYKEADFVIKAKVLSKHRESQGPGSSFAFITFLEYQVKVAKIFKGRRRFSPDVQVQSLYTPEGGSCGIRSLKPGRNYLISGYHENGTFYLSVCSWVEEWSALTKEQKKGLKSKYATQCRKCEVPIVTGSELVMTLIDPSVPQGLVTPPRKLYSLSGLWANEPGTCTYNPVDSWQYPTSDCETLFTYCTKETIEGCAWQINNIYKDCFVDRETAWVKREVKRSTLRGRTGSMRLGSQRLGCSLETPDEEFDVCIRNEVEKIVTQFL